MTIHKTSLEEAQALGFASLEECDQHQRWLSEQSAHAAAERAYQKTAEAEARRIAAAEAAGCDPASIAWVSQSQPGSLILRA